MGARVTASTSSPDSPVTPFSYVQANGSTTWPVTSVPSEAGRPNTWLNPNAAPFAPKGPEGDPSPAAVEVEPEVPILINDDGTRCIIDDPTAPPTRMGGPNGSGINQPCLYCGEEATLECSNCVNLRRKGFPVAPTFFCCPEHQQKVWKKHHEEVHQKFAAKKLQNGTAPSGGAAQEAVGHRG